MRNGDFSNTSSFASLGQLLREHGAQQPRERPHPGQPDRPERAGPARPASRCPTSDPALTRGYNYAQNVELDQNMHQWLTRVDVNVSDNDARVRALQHAGRRTELPGRSLVAQPQPGALSDGGDGAQSLALIDREPDAHLRADADDRVDVCHDLHRLPEPVRGSEQGVAGGARLTTPGIYGNNGLDQIPSMTAWGNGPTMFNPGGFDPVLFATKWLISGAQNVTKVAGAHTLKVGVYYEWVNNSQPGNGDSNGRLVPASWGANGTTGNYFADLLTGTLAEYGEQSPNIVRDMAYNIFEGYVQDSWKVEQPADRRPRPAAVAPRRVVRAQRRRHGGLRSGAVQRQRAGHRLPAASPGRPGRQRADLGRRHPAGVPGAARRLCLRPVGQRRARCCAVATASSTSTTRRARTPGFIDLPYGVTFTNTFNVPLSQSLQRRSQRATRAIGGTILRDDDDQPRTQSWSLTVQQRLPWRIDLETAYVGSKSDRLLNAGVGEHQLRAVRRNAERSDGRPEQYRPLPQYGGLNGRATAHAVPELQQPAGAVEPADVEVQHDRGVHVLEGAGHSRRRPGGGRDSAWRHPRDFAYGVLGYDRTHVFNIGYSWLLPDVENSALINAFLGGWQLTGVSTYISGAPLQPLAHDRRQLRPGRHRCQRTATISAQSYSGTPTCRHAAAHVRSDDWVVTGDQILNPRVLHAAGAGTNGHLHLPVERPRAGLHQQRLRGVQELQPRWA